MKDRFQNLKIRIVIDGMRGEESIAELCRREGIDKQLDCSLLDLNGDCKHVALWCEVDKIKQATRDFLKLE